MVLGALRIEAPEVSLRQDRALQVRAPEVRAIEPGSPEVDPLEVGARQAGPPQVGPGQVEEIIVAQLEAFIAQRGAAPLSLVLVLGSCVSRGPQLARSSLFACLMSRWP